MVARPVAPRRCGIAIGSDALVAVAPNGGRAAWQRAVSPLEGATWPALVLALREGVEAGVIASPVRIALLPPLVEVRTVSIPPVNDDDARRLLTHAATRHFVAAREPMDVAVTTAATGSARVAAAVPARTLRAILDAMREAQLQVDVVVPAQVALIHGAQQQGTTTRAVLAEFGDTIERLSSARGELTDVRRFRREGDEAAIADAIRTDGDVARIVDTLAASATAMAASTTDRWPLALTETTPQASDGSRGTARSWWLIGAAAALALGTVALQEIDVRRELTAVRAERAALAPRLAVPSARDAERLASAGLRVDGPRWSSVLGAIGDALPSDAFITRLRAQSDTVIVEGSAARATAAFDALAAAPWVGTIRASAPIRRETANDGVVTEKFEFTITLTER